LRTSDQQTHFDIQNQKTGKHWKTECQVADRPPYQFLDSPGENTGSPVLPGCGPSAVPSRTIRDRKLTQAEADPSVTFNACFSLSHTLYVKECLADCEASMVWIHTWTLWEILRVHRPCLPLGIQVLKKFIQILHVLGFLQVGL
jgi:hypothetical protein